MRVSQANTPKSCSCLGCLACVHKANACCCFWSQVCSGCFTLPFHVRNRWEWESGFIYSHQYCLSYSLTSICELLFICCYSESMVIEVYSHRTLRLRYTLKFWCGNKVLLLNLEYSSPFTEIAFFEETSAFVSANNIPLFCNGLSADANLWCWIMFVTLNISVILTII